MADPRPRNGSFGRLVLLGVVSAGVLALASAKEWVDYDITSGGRPVPREPGAADLGALPLAGALGLLLLAAWGILLVSRGRVRRSIGVLGVLVSLGIVACVVYGVLALPGDVRQGFPAAYVDAYVVTTRFTGWLWVAAVAAVVSTVVTALSVVAMPRWPEMGKRYDAPAAGGPSVVPAADDPEADNLALWKAIDAGGDPTDTADPSGTPRPGPT